MKVWILTIHIEDLEEDHTLCSSLDVVRRVATEYVSTNNQILSWHNNTEDLMRLAAEISSTPYAIVMSRTTDNNWLTWTEQEVIE